ncbi:MAG: carbon-nitrogen hydrolase family protein [Eubacterium sp.]
MKVQIACCQLLLSDNKAKNLKNAETMIRTEAQKGTKIIVLPEMFICPYCNSNFITAAEPEDGPTLKFIAQLAKELKLIIFAGSIPERDNDKIYNTCFVFDQSGKCIGKHRKIHLFDVAIKNGVSFKESNVLSAGDTITVVKTDFGPIGIAICFDVRFVEIFRIMVQEGAKLIVIPAAFNMTTGPLHWELAMRARAVDNQCFIAACSSARNLGATYYAWGHSCIIDPWGTVLADALENEGSIRSTIDITLVDSVREQLPILSAVKSDIYTCQKISTKKTAT